MRARHTPHVWGRSASTDGARLAQHRTSRALPAIAGTVIAGALRGARPPPPLPAPEEASAVGGCGLIVRAQEI